MSDLDIDKLAETYSKQSALAKAATAQADKIKEILKQELRERGEADDKGHLWLPGQEWMVKLQRTVNKPTFLESDAMEWADEMDILDELVTHVVPDPYDILDEDKLAAWVYKNKEYEAKVKTFYKENITWALPQPVQAPQYEY